jgi:murein DD-endopeptidase MepM/ murein hydrolase activator NlpD
MNRKPTLVLLLLSPLLVLILGSTAYLAYRFRPAVRLEAAGRGAAGPEARVPAEPVLTRHKEKIARGRTLAEILSGFDFSGAEIERLKTDVAPVYNIARITSGHELRLFVDTALRVRRLEYDVDDQGYLCVRREGDRFAAEIKPFPYEIRPELVWGTIEDTAIAAFNKAGEADTLAMAFAEIFAWDVDFYLDARRGDAFALVVQKKYLDGRFVGYGDVLAAEYVNAGKLFRAVRYTSPDTGKPDYYDAEGGSMRKEFMKSPLKYTRITSRFTASRFHPILKVYTSHFAVDFAAAVGTPVKATAPGTVLFAGWNGGAGRMIHLRHKGGYETMYLHLSRFAEGTRPGAQVESGQVIGYVGDSGEATGPHLDYRIKFHGQYINPLGYRFKSADPVRPEYLEDFKAKARGLLGLLDLPWLQVRCFLAAA